jgi:hypothetical protein
MHESLLEYNDCYITVIIIYLLPRFVNRKRFCLGAPGMGDNLAVKVHYGLGSRNR